MLVLVMLQQLVRDAREDGVLLDANNPILKDIDDDINEQDDLLFIATHERSLHPRCCHIQHTNMLRRLLLLVIAGRRHHGKAFDAHH